MIELTQQTFILYSIGIGLAGYVFGLFAAYWSAAHTQSGPKEAGKSCPHGYLNWDDCPECRH
jgi:hypothetical protein